MLSCHTERSLCLVDEFGKGTAPIDGVALLGTVMTRFVQAKTRALFAVHFTEVLDEHLLSKETRDGLTVFRMETLLDPSSDVVAGRVIHTPLYQLGLGLSTESHGIVCAKGAGISEDVLDRAYHVKHCLQSRSVLYPPLGYSDIPTNCLNLVATLLHTDWTNCTATDLAQIKRVASDINISSDELTHLINDICSL